MLEINGTIVAVIINFLILFWILSKFFYKPLEEIIEQRKKIVSDSYEQAQKSLSEAQLLKTEYEQKIKDLEARSKEILDTATITAKKMQTDILNEAKTEANNIILSAKKDAEIIKNEMIVYIKSVIAELIFASVKKILQKNIDEKSNNEIIEEAIQNLEKMELN